MKNFAPIIIAAAAFLPVNAHADANAYQCRTNNYLTHVRTDTPWRAHVVTYIHLTDRKKFPSGGATVNKIRCRLHPMRTLTGTRRPPTQIRGNGGEHSQ